MDETTNDILYQYDLTNVSILFRKQDVRCATDALNRLQGFILLSSERGGIRIEYAKTKDHMVRVHILLLPIIA